MRKWSHDLSSEFLSFDEAREPWEHGVAVSETGEEAAAGVHVVGCATVTAWKTNNKDGFFDKEAFDFFAIFFVEIFEQQATAEDTD